MEEAKFKFNFPKTGCLDFHNVENLIKSKFKNTKEMAKIINNYLITDLEKETIENFGYENFMKLVFSLNQVFKHLFDLQNKKLSSIREGHRNYNEINNQYMKIKNKLENQDKKNNNLKQYLKRINNMIEEVKENSKNVKCVYLCNFCSETNVNYKNFKH